MANDHVTTGATQQQALFHLSHTLPNDPNGCSLIFIELEGAHESGGCAAALYGRETRGTLGACSAGVESGNPALTNPFYHPSEPTRAFSFDRVTDDCFIQRVCVRSIVHPFFLFGYDVFCAPDVILAGPSFTMSILLYMICVCPTTADNDWFICPLLMVTPPTPLATHSNSIICRTDLDSRIPRIKNAPKRSSHWKQK
jgi:hypothetical protein